MSDSKDEVQLNGVRFLPLRSIARTHSAQPQHLLAVSPARGARLKMQESALVGTHSGTSCAPACL
eukprot:3170300-Amphidinium_carterae.1